MSSQSRGNTLGQALREIRTERRITPTQLEKRSGISRASIYAIEGGKGRKPYTDTLIKLANGLAFRHEGEPDQTDSANVYRRLSIAAGIPVAPTEYAPGEAPEDRVAQILAEHPEIKVAFAQFGDLDEDDAEMIVNTIEYVAKRSAQKRERDGA